MTLLNGHPSDETLVRIACGEAANDNREHIKAHVDRCDACEARLCDIRTMRALLTEAPTVTAPDALLHAALERRARQERVLLMHAAPSPSTGSGVARTSRRLAQFAVAATLAMAAFSLWPREKPATIAVRRGVADSTLLPGALPTPSDDSPFGALSPWPLVAYAQSASGVPDVPYPAITEFDTTAVTPGTRRYVQSSASSYHDYMPINAEAIELRDTTFNDVPVWRVVTSSPFHASQYPRADTAWIRRSDMQLIARRNESAAASLRQRLLPGDTVLEERTVVHVPDEVRMKMNPAFLRFTSRTVVKPGQLLITDRSYFHLLVRSLPLHSTWRGSIDLNVGQTRNLSPAILGKTRSINVSVQGDSVVSTLWGNVPSWRVVLHTGPTPERWYVSKAGHEVLLVTGPYATEWPRNRFDLIGRYVK